MADRFWVGASFNAWTSADTSNWAATSGGSSGASVPTSADNAIFDANSGTGTVLVDSLSDNSVDCLNLDFTGYTGSFEVSGACSVNIYGNLLMSSDATYTYGGSTSIYFYFQGSGSHTLTTNGMSPPQVGFVGNGTYTLQDAFDNTQGISTAATTISSGNFDTNDLSFKTYAINATSASASALFGSSNITVGSGINTNSNASLNFGTSTINLGYAGGPSSTTLNGVAGGGSGITVNNVVCVSATCNFTGPNTYSDFTVNTGGKIVRFQNSVTHTLTGSIDFGGQSGSKTTIRSNSAGTQFTIARTGDAVYADYVDVIDSIGSPADTWFVNPESTLSNTSGWSFYGLSQITGLTSISGITSLTM